MDHTRSAGPTNTEEGEVAGGVFETRSSQVALEWCAVLASQDIDFELSREGRLWRFKTSSANFAKARSNIDAYEGERDFFRRHLSEDELRESRRIPLTHQALPFVFISILMILFYLITSSQAHVDGGYYERGMMIPGAFRDSQLWRAATALTLHADMAHVLANCTFFTIFAVFISFRTGPGASLAAIFAGGLLGNATSALILGPRGYNSIGFSTAVFAAIGIHCSLAFLSKRTQTGFFLLKFAPIAAGVALLALTGTAYGSDLLAHLTGFFWGVILAFPLYFLKPKRHFMLQSPLFVSVFIIVFYSWSNALN